MKPPVDFSIDGPEAVAGEALVVAEEGRQDVGLDLVARGRPTAGDEVHHVGIAVELDEVVDIVLGEPPQHQALGLEKDLHARILVSRRGTLPGEPLRSRPRVAPSG